MKCRRCTDKRQREQRRGALCPRCMAARLQARVDQLLAQVANERKRKGLA